MVEGTVRRKNQKKFQEEIQESEERGAVLSISGTALDVIGKIALCAGVTALLLHLFTAFEVLLGLGVVVSACMAVGGGAISMLLGNKLRSGFWVEGLVAA